MPEHSSHFVSPHVVQVSHRDNEAGESKEYMAHQTALISLNGDPIPTLGQFTTLIRTKASEWGRAKRSKAVRLAADHPSSKIKCPLGPSSFSVVPSPVTHLHIGITRGFTGNQ